MRLSSKSNNRMRSAQGNYYPEIIFPAVKSGSLTMQKKLVMDDDASRWCAAAAADWWCYSYRVLLKGLPTTTCHLSTRGDSHTNAACVHVCASVVRVRGERSGEGRGGTRCCSLTTMIERTKIPDAAQQRATVSRVDICIVGEISPFGFRLYASTLSNLSSRLVGIPPGNLSRLAETKPGPMIDSHCEID